MLTTASYLSEARHTAVLQATVSLGMEYESALPFLEGFPLDWYLSCLSMSTNKELAYSERLVATDNKSTGQLAHVKQEKLQC